MEIFSKIYPECKNENNDSRALRNNIAAEIKVR